MLCAENRHRKTTTLTGALAVATLASAAGAVPSVTALAGPRPAPYPSGHAWRFDTVHSSIRFSVRRMLAPRVEGQFTKWRGTMAFDPAHPEASQLSVRIDADSIDTGAPERDAHLRSPDFLDAAHHRVLTLQSLRIAPRDENPSRFAVTSALQIRGLTREVTIDAAYAGTVRDAWGNDHLAFRATTRIDRGAFGLKWNQVLPTGELFVGESVEITMDIQATRLPVNMA